MDKKMMLLNMLKRVCSPSEVVSGPDSIRRLQTLSEGKALLVAAPSTQSNDILNQGLDLLSKGGNHPVTYIATSGEPSVLVTKAIAKQMVEIEPEWIIALGGGSVLDAVKIAWACYEHRDLDFTQLPPITVPPLRNKARLIAIPTTAGSGAESSQAAVLKSDSCRSVLPYVSPEWIPDIVILDPKLTVSLPPTLTAHTGMDALTHAIEAYVSRLSGPMIKTMAVSAIHLILRNLAVVYNKPDDLLARENMLNGAYLGGLCQSAVSTGLAHALTHASSAVLGTSHGAGNALFLFPAMCFNKKKNASPFESLVEALGYELSKLFEKVEQLTEEICLPRTLSNISRLPVNQTQCSVIAERAMDDICMRTNPQKPQKEELCTLLESLK